ncbi:hypothetical protein PMAYCL1PPCAC_15391, partial [Pristionchus mayeri]
YLPLALLLLKLLLFSNGRFRDTLTKYPRRLRWIIVCISTVVSIVLPAGVILVPSVLSLLEVLLDLYRRKVVSEHLVDDRKLKHRKDGGKNEDDRRNHDFGLLFQYRR